MVYEKLVLKSPEKLAAWFPEYHRRYAYQRKAKLVASFVSFVEEYADRWKPLLDDLRYHVAPFLRDPIARLTMVSRWDLPMARWSPMMPRQFWSNLVDVSKHSGASSVFLANYVMSESLYPRMDTYALADYMETYQYIHYVGSVVSWLIHNGDKLGSDSYALGLVSILGREAVTDLEILEALRPYVDEPIRTTYHILERLKRNELLTPRDDFGKGMVFDVAPTHEVLAHLQKVVG